MTNRTPNRGPLPSLSIVSSHGPLGIAAGAPNADDPNERPADGTVYHGIDKVLNIGPGVGKALDERTYGHRGRKP